MERFGAYELFEQLGASERGTVHRAMVAAGDSSTRAVAIKRYPASVFSTSAAASRHAVDAAQISQLRHPNIVVIHKVGRLGDTTYLEMEHVEGRSIDELLHEIRIDGPPPTEVVVSLVAELADALAFAHQHGVMHGGIRPCHLLIAWTGHLKVLGFGTAQLARVQSQRCYAAPESLRGEPVDERADLYSLGVIAYELITGRPLFDEHVDPELRGYLASGVTPPASCNPACPSQLDDLILRALAPDPDQRFATAAELCQAIELIGGPEPARVSDWLGRRADSPRSGTEAAVPPALPDGLAPLRRRVARGTGRLSPRADPVQMPEDDESAPEAAAWLADPDPWRTEVDAWLLAPARSLHDAETVIRETTPPPQRGFRLPLEAPAEPYLDVELVDACEASVAEEPAPAADLSAQAVAAIPVTPSPVCSPRTAPSDEPGLRPEPESRGLRRWLELSVAFVAGAVTAYLLIAWLG